MATPVRSAPSNSRPTSDGTTNSAEARGRFGDRGECEQLLHLSNAACNARLVFRSGDPVGNGRKLLAILRGVLHRTQIER